MILSCAQVCECVKASFSASHQSQTDLLEAVKKQKQSANGGFPFALPLNHICTLCVLFVVQQTNKQTGLIMMFDDGCCHNKQQKQQAHHHCIVVLFLPHQ
jgi:hypothetical protein